MRKEAFFKMQDEDFTLKCPKGRINYMFEIRIN